MKQELRLVPYSDGYTRLLFGDEYLGMVETKGSGYLVYGKKKPVPTLKEAAKQIIERKMNKCMKEHETHQKILQRILNA